MKDLTKIKKEHAKLGEMEGQGQAASVVLLTDDMIECDQAATCWREQIRFSSLNGMLSSPMWKNFCTAC